MMRRYPARMAETNSTRELSFFPPLFILVHFLFLLFLTVCFPALDFYLTCNPIGIDISTWFYSSRDLPFQSQRKRTDRWRDAIPPQVKGERRTFVLCCAPTNQSSVPLLATKLQHKITFTHFLVQRVAFTTFIILCIVCIRCGIISVDGVRNIHLYAMWLSRTFYYSTRHSRDHDGSSVR